MTALTLLTGLQKRGAVVTANGAKLKLLAPRGVLKPRVLDAIREHKAELLELLTPLRRPDFDAGGAYDAEYSDPAHRAPALDGMPQLDFNGALGLWTCGGWIVPTRATAKNLEKYWKRHGHKYPRRIEEENQEEQLCKAA
jgi:hypothetical protein